jgi:hypothetical protein
VGNRLRQRAGANPEADRGAPFVISLGGAIYSDPTGRATDRELAKGAKEVLGAGRWIVEQGRVLVIANESPTYRPSLAQMQAAVARLAEMGADLVGDGEGLLVIVHAVLDKNGRGALGKRYRARKSANGVELTPENTATVNVEDPIVEAAARARHFARSGDSKA